MGETEKEQMEEKTLASTRHEVPSNFSAMVAPIERIKLIFARRLLFQCVILKKQIVSKNQSHFLLSVRLILRILEKFCHGKSTIRSVVVDQRR